MHLGIDASNIISGGGLTHLAELLRAADPVKHNFSKVTLWSNSRTLQKIVDRPWLNKLAEPLLERAFPFRFFWQKNQLAISLKEQKCDVLFVPGGIYSGSFRPFVTMSQNILPFERSEVLRYGFSWQYIRNRLLRRSQSSSFRRADGVIFLTEYARNGVLNSVNNLPGASAVIPHGLDETFFCQPRPQLPAASFSAARPFRLLYVSLVDFYKHQWHVIAATAELRKAGVPVTLDLIGPAYKPALEKMLAAMALADPAGKFIKYHGAVPFDQLAGYYQNSELFVFASGCETISNILLESMASGLPIASSNYGAMQEILGEAGLFFDPESPARIAATIREYFVSPELRASKARLAFERASSFSWKRCAEETMSFLQGFRGK